jgi:16S rRNA (guanine(1405)-N(7))-methyltransferase
MKWTNLKEAIKATKNKLHQISGAYLEKVPTYSRWLQNLQDIDLLTNKQALKASCLQILASHASTRERLPILDNFYSELFSHLPPVKKILDIACGFNPLTIPWMPLEQDAIYWAWDIYADMIAFINSFFGLIRQPGQAEVRDVLALTTTPKVDLALILKTIPCLGQVDKSIGVQFLSVVQARYLFVSFPVSSLGGREKGMIAHYEAEFDRMVSGQTWQVKRIQFATELVFLVDKGG